MRDQEDRAALSPLREIGQHLLLRGGVEGGGRLVEDQDRRVLEDGASDREALPLSRRQLRPAFAEQRVVAFRQFFDELASPCDARRLADLFVGRGGNREADVLAHRVSEQDVLLQRDRDPVAQAGGLEALEVDPVDLDLSGGRIEEPQQQRHQGALARACRADDGSDCSDLRGEIQLVEYGAVGLILEADSSEANSLADALERNRVRFVLHVGTTIHHLEDAIETDRDVLGTSPDSEDVLQSLDRASQASLEVVVQTEIPDREAESCRGQLRLLHRLDGSQRSHEQGEGSEHPEHRHRVDRVEVPGSKGGTEGAVAGAVEGALLDTFRPVGLDDLDARQGFLDASGERGVCLPGAAEAGAHSCREPASDDQAREDDGEEDQPEYRREQAHHHHREQELRNRRERNQHQHLDQLGDHRAVLVQPVDGVSNAVVGVKAQGEALQVGEQVDPELLVDSLEDPHLVVVEADEDRDRDGGAPGAPPDQPRGDERAHRLVEARRGRGEFDGQAEEDRFDLEHRLALKNASPEGVDEDQHQRSDQQGHRGEACKEPQDVLANRPEQSQAAQQDAEDEPHVKAVVRAAVAESAQVLQIGGVGNARHLGGGCLSHSSFSMTSGYA